MYTILFMFWVMLLLDYCNHLVLKSRFWDLQQGYKINLVLDF